MIFFSFWDKAQDFPKKLHSVKLLWPLPANSSVFMVLLAVSKASVEKFSSRDWQNRIQLLRYPFTIWFQPHDSCLVGWLVGFLGGFLYWDTFETLSNRRIPLFLVLSAPVCPYFLSSLIPPSIYHLCFDFYGVKLENSFQLSSLFWLSWSQAWK